ncbi:MAG: diguanylate cyclase [Chitinophagaceae bacterium]|nr:diguanylate cyclase [Oligoflexus sp.]
MALTTPIKSYRLPDESVPGYRDLRTVFESPRSRVFTAVRNGDNKRVVLKILQEDFVERSEIARYKNQFTILNDHKLQCSPQVLAYEKHLSAPMLVFEDLGGISLAHLISESPLTLLEGLDVAQKIAKALVEIHSKNIIHKDINPSNVLYNRGTGEVRLIDFGISTCLLREQAEAMTQSVTEGSLPYMSPEQTGRMNRFVDYRSDFYSFGVSLYEIFAGRLPFEADDSLRLIHFHIAKKPLPPRQFNAQIPEILSDLILRLMSKNAEERYQSAWGIMQDLQKIFRALKNSEKIEKFPLGLQDIPDRFHIPEVLYGRQKESATLLRVLSRTREGSRELCLVSGYSGVGKTRLIRALQKPVVSLGGHFISGKFDAFRRSVPYSAFVDAFRELIRQLLGESEMILGNWRDKLAVALGPNGQIMVEVIPEIEMIIGRQAPYQAMGPTEADNRFKMVFRNFVGVFCDKTHPLVIHLDDLQWIDSASMSLIEMLLQDKRLKHLLFVGSYRDNELTEHHPLHLFSESLRLAEMPLETIHLGSLEHSEVTQLIADAMHTTVERVQNLTKLVMDKTAGNPFFTDEFLRNLYRSQLLYFDPDKGSWDWDLDKIRASRMTDNVIELMGSRIQKLQPAARHAVQMASCIGLIFDLVTLAAVGEQTLAEAAASLKEPIAQGLIVPIGDAYRLVELDIPLDGREISVEYRFSHDRIQQAAYDLIDEEGKAQVRFKAGRTLLSLHKQARLDDYLFAIVNHLNASYFALETNEQRLELIELNVMAARKAKTSAAYVTALDYLESAMRMEQASDWKNSYELFLSIYREAAEVAFLGKSFDSMQLYVDQVLKHGRTLLEKIPAYETRVHAAIARNDMHEAITMGKKILKELDISLPQNPSTFHIAVSLLYTKWKLRRYSQDDLLQLPAMTDPIELARMHFLYSMAQAIFYFFPKQVPLITSRLVRKSLKHGNTATSALAYTTYGMIMAAMVGDVKEGYRLGELGIKLYERHQAKDIEAATLVCFNMFIRPWKDHIRSTLTPLLQAHQAGLDSGDFEFAAHAAIGYCNRSFFTGSELKSLSQDLLKFSLVIEQLAQRNDEEQIKLLHQMVINFTEYRSVPSLLRGDTFDEDRMLPIYERTHDSAGSFTTYFYKVMLAYHFGSYGEAVLFGRAAEPHFKSVMGTLSGAVFYYYYALALMSSWNDAKSSERALIKGTVKTVLKKFIKWAKQAPMNFSHKYLLIKAEWLSLTGHVYAAQTHYDLAIAGARTEHYLQDEALANELAAKFHLKHGRQTAAYAYMKRARYNYERWGAHAKSRQLEERFPQMLTSYSGERALTGSLATMSSSTIDITTLKRALLAIAEENVHSRMLEKIISSAIEFAGAQKGALLLRKDGEFFIEGESSIDHDQPRILQSTALEHSHSVSRMVVNYVKRSRKGLVIDNASEPQDMLPGLHREAYIETAKVLSILCIPITVGIGEDAQIVGLLYLENSRASGTFTSERIETLEIICLAAAGRLELSVKAATDGLTGLYNHDYFQNMLEQELLQSQRQLRNLSLLLIDIDHFKKFNDQWGHQTGDLVLKKVAQAIRDTCRKSDIVARYGGEEMAVILPETSSEMGALVAERIRKNVESLAIPHGDILLKVTISLGLSSLTDSLRDKAAMIEKADGALYQSKGAGRNRMTIA